MIKHIIFDLDDTLCDYRKATRKCRGLVLTRYLNVHEIGTDVFWKRFNQVEPVLFRQICQQVILAETNTEFVDSQMCWRVSMRSLANLTTELNHIYMRETIDRIELFDDSIPLMKALQSKEIEAVILTNGPSGWSTSQI